MGLRTVQGEVERVLSHLLHQQVEVQCAGRTDAGVHATGQVAHVDAGAWPAEVDAGRINRALPGDIRVVAIDRAPDGFDARFSALWRRYVYRVSDDGLGPAPLARSHVLAWHRRLDLEAMNEAAGPLLGEHDFAPFCKQREFASTVRAVQVLRWDRDATGLAVMTVQADAFCHSMVRSLVGALVEVGGGRRDLEWLAGLLTHDVRSGDVPVMPARGLVLEEVGYPADDQLATRVTEARARRELNQERP